MKVQVKENKLIIEIDMDEKRPLSASGKSRVVASTRGNLTTEIQVDGKPLVVAVNAYIKS